MEDKINEHQLIFELIRFKDYDKNKINTLLSDSIDFPYVLGQLIWNRVGGVAFYVLKQCELLQKLNREFRNSLKSIYDINIIKTKAFKGTLSELEICFRNAEFKYAFLKGSFLNLFIYPEGLRTSNDFDILLSQNNITACCNILKSNGFTQGYYRYGQGILPATRQEILSSRMNRGETVPFLKKSTFLGMDIIEVDINFSLDFKAKNERDVVSEMLEETQSFDVYKGNKLYTLSMVDFLIQLCVHLYKEATVYNWVEMQRDLSLYKFCDIYAFLFEFGNVKFFKELSGRIIEFGLEKECFYSLKYTYEIYPSLKNITNFEELLKTIYPNNILYLKQIIYPSKNIIYRYEMDLIDWLFCCKRKDYLIKTKELFTNDETA